MPSDRIAMESGRAAGLGLLAASMILAGAAVGLAFGKQGPTGAPGLFIEASLGPARLSLGFSPCFSSVGGCGHAGGFVANARLEGRQ